MHILKLRLKIHLEMLNINLYLCKTENDFETVGELEFEIELLYEHKSLYL